MKPGTADGRHTHQPCVQVKACVAVGLCQLHSEEPAELRGSLSGRIEPTAAVRDKVFEPPAACPTHATDGAPAEQKIVEVIGEPATVEWGEAVVAQEYDGLAVGRCSLMAMKSPPSKSVLAELPSDRPVAQAAKTPCQCC